MLQRIYFALLVTMVLAAAALPAPAQKVLAENSPAQPQVIEEHPQVHALQIGPGDLLDLVVFDTPELSAKVRVDQFGTVNLPVAGAMPISGMTAEQASAAIEARLKQKDILKSPHVSITVLEYATQGVTVVGEVKNPGVYPLLGAHGLLDLISAAGGATPNASRTVTITHRSDPAHPVIAEIGVKPGSTAGMNVDVRPGDTVMVAHAGIVYVVGDVGKPGGFLIENNDRLTVLQAIALAQGTNRTAALNHARLIRKQGGDRQEVPVALKKILANKAPDQPLEDGDILFVPTSGTKSMLRGLATALPSAASATIYRVP